MEPSAPALIDVDRVSVSIDGLPLLAPMSLRVGPGRIVAVRGANGVGKTTLLRVLAGRTRPTAGAVRIAGRPVDERASDFRRRVAAMIGLPPMADDLTLFDHVALVASTWQRGRDLVDRAAERVLEEFGLTALGARFPHELSSGQMQLAGLSMILVRPFEVLLLDEPEQRLDPDRVQLLARALRVRRARGATIVMATHSGALTELAADETLRLSGAA